jgi:hypothetical protein
MQLACREQSASYANLTWITRQARPNLEKTMIDPMEAGEAIVSNGGQRYPIGAKETVRRCESYSGWFASIADDFLLGLILDPEHGNYIFFRNIALSLYYVKISNTCTPQWKLRAWQGIHFLNLLICLLLWHYATNRKIEGSIHDKVNF